MEKARRARGFLTCVLMTRDATSPSHSGHSAEGRWQVLGWGLCLLLAAAGHSEVQPPPSSRPTQVDGSAQCQALATRIAETGVGTAEGGRGALTVETLPVGGDHQPGGQHVVH